MHVITGASSGIGRGVALALIERGETVLAIARRAERLADLGEGATALAADVSLTGGRTTIVSSVARRRADSSSA